MNTKVAIASLLTDMLCCIGHPCKKPLSQNKPPLASNVASLGLILQGILFVLMLALNFSKLSVPRLRA